MHSFEHTQPRRHKPACSNPARSCNTPQLADDRLRDAQRMQRQPTERQHYCACGGACPRCRPKLSGRSATPSLQRTPADEPSPRRDVAIVGEGWLGAEELAALLARGGNVYNVTSLQTAKDALDAIDFPVRTLYFITHSDRLGDMQFGEGEGYVDPSRIGAKFKDLIAPEHAPLTVDFRGCGVGSDPKAMEKIRKAFGAESVVAGTCFAVISYSTPITILGIPITKESDLEDRDPEPSFDEMYEGTLENFGGARKCVLNPSRDAFFANGGTFVALWFNPNAEGGWQTGASVCYSELTPQIVDPKAPDAAADGCQIVVVNKPAEKGQEAPAESPAD